MKPDSTESLWADLEANCHLRSAQVIIRRAIVRRTIRVVHAPGDRIRILPVNGTSRVQESEDPTAVEPGLNGHRSSVPLVPIERITR